MRLPTRLQDAPTEVTKLAEAMADAFVDVIVAELARQCTRFDMDDPEWRDLVIGICELAAMKARET